MSTATWAGMIRSRDGSENGNVSEAKLMAPARDVGYIIVAKVLCERGDYTQLETVCQYTYQLYTEKRNLIGVILSLNFQCIQQISYRGVPAGGGADRLLEESLEVRGAGRLCHHFRRTRL